MRLFYAVNFENNIKEALFENLKEIKKYTVRGNFTEKDNFHITLVFIGECEPDKLSDLKKVADNIISKINPPQIKAVIDGLGTFKRPGDELLWVGLKINPEDIDIINKINKNIIGELAEYNIKINDSNQKFKPHVTLARKIGFKRLQDIKYIKFKPVDLLINSLTLMESVQIIETYGERKYTKIIYKPVYEVKF
ncbi:MAG: RNA 2',3'-cyclic phosphodiesterase [Oscillospiraceae bacterium]|nr:RNA 2',3'-cyclic phosphodiesterase [Oscillospiraceae bacterium]